MYSCAWTVTKSAMKLKTGSNIPKQCKHVRTLNALQTTNSVHNTMHASTVRRVWPTATSSELRC